MNTNASTWGDRARLGGQRRWAIAAACAIGALLVCGAQALGVTHLKPGDPAPKLSASGLGGKSVEVPDPRGEIQVLLFGDSSHPRVGEMASQVGTALADPRMEGVDVQWVMILSADSDTEAALAGLDKAARDRVTVVVDADRAAFEAYHVFVVPSLAIIDGKGRIVRTVAGANPRGADGLLEDMLTGAGRPTQENVKHDPASAKDENTERVARLTRMGEQLARRGLLEGAEKSYREALRIAPRDVNANLDLGDLLNRLGRSEEAAPRFELVLKDAPESARGQLGLIEAHLGMKDADLSGLEEALRTFIGLHPENARAHFLLGTAQERRGDFESASASFKRAASLLFSAMEARPSEE